MKKIIFIAVFSASAAAFATTVVTTTTVKGKNTGTTVTGSTLSINCDNTVDIVCYTTTTTTSSQEVPGTMNPGDPVTVNPYDEKGNPTQQQISGTFVSAYQQPDPNDQNVTDYFINLNFQQ